MRRCFDLKNKNKSERKQRIKKQLVSTGVYIALAVTVMVITSNSVKKVLNSVDSYEIPEINNIKNNISLPSLEDTEKKDNGQNNGEEPKPLPEMKEISPDELIVSDNPENVSPEVNEPVILPEITENEAVSGEPEDVETYPPVPEQSRKDDRSRFDSDSLPEVVLKPTAGYISREFSKDELIYTPTMNDFRTHNGIDLTGDIGSPVVAFADGVIEDVYDDPFLGTTVVVRHSGGLVSSYSNLSPELPQNIAVGNIVEVGMTIGGIGESAIIESAEAPHVHLELYKDEICVNPEEYLG